VGLLTKLLFFPVAGPVAGIRWTLGQVQRVAEQELTDDSKIKNDLMELQLRLELGEIDEAEYASAEAVLVQRLREVREWRERLGRS
jgi:Gas vesicle protein G